MKTRKLFLLPAVCCALALTLGVCGEEKQENAKAEAEAKGKAKLIFSEDGKTLTGVKYKGIKPVVIPNGVTSIGEGAFFFCSSLKSITIPDSVTSIGDGAFRCVQSVQVSTKNPVFSVDGSGVLINKKEKKLLYVPANVSGHYTIPSSVTSIGDGAFWGCSNLTRITIPDSVTSIGDNAFWDCDNLTSVTIGNGVTSIGEWAFEGCSSLRSVTIPTSVTSIGESAFLGCKNLTSITIPAKFTDEDVKEWNLSYRCIIIRR